MQNDLLQALWDRGETRAPCVLEGCLHSRLAEQAVEWKTLSVTTILLDGLWGNPARLFLMRRRLEASGIGRVSTFAYASGGFACLEAQGARLAAHVRTVEGPVNLVGYSMGGLVIRAACLVDPELPVRRAAFLNTPHAGSFFAMLAPGIAFRQMRPGGGFLQKLDSINWDIPTLAVWTPGDMMVIPAESARWSRATRVTSCRVPAHIWPIFSAAVHRDLAEFLAKEL